MLTTFFRADLTEEAGKMELLALAQDCYELKGSAVFTAESLYFQLYPTAKLEKNCDKLPEGGKIDVDHKPAVFSTHLRVSPNPAEASINFTYVPQNDAPAHWRIYDANGRLYLEGKEASLLKEVTFQKTLNISSLPTGVYRLSVQQGKSVQVATFVKQ